jgi:tetratricopeptide (TPR) repeat protein
MPRIRLADLLREQGGNAEEQLLALLKLDRKHPLAQLGLARVYLGKREFARSEDLLRRCLDNPHTAKAAHALLGQLQQSVGNAAEAEATAKKSRSLPADMPWPDPYWADALLYRMGKKARLEDVSALLDGESFDDARRALQLLTVTYPAEDEMWYLLGWTCNRQGDYAEAERALREHGRLSPQSPKGQSQLAVALLGQSRFEDAVRVLQNGLKLKPSSRELHFNLGYAASRLGRKDEAIGHLRRALALEPNHAPTYTALAELLAGQGNSGEAAPLVRQALLLEPTNSRAQALQLQLESLRP